MNGNRERIKAENPEATFGELGRFAGAAWKEMDSEAKAEYEEKAAQDKERYKRELSEYKVARNIPSYSSQYSVLTIHYLPRV